MRVSPFPLLLLVVGTALALDNTGFADHHGKLKLDGNQLVSAAGQPIQLTGMSSHGITWFSNCYSKASMQHLVTLWGINLWRIAMYVNTPDYAPQGYNCDTVYSNRDCQNARATIMQTVENQVQWAKELGIYVIIDWHILKPGNPNADEYRDANNFWTTIAQKYKDEKHVLYEICNEPNGDGVNWVTVKQYANPIIAAIRKIDVDTIIIVGTPTWSQDIDQAAASPVDQPRHVMYTFHFYAGTHSHLLSRVETYRTKIPLFVTEWGTSVADGGISDTTVYWTEAKRFLDTFKGDPDNGVPSLSWAQWSYADKNEASAALQQGACGQQQWSKTSTSGQHLKEYIQQNAQTVQKGPGTGGRTKPPVPPTVAAAITTTIIADNTGGGVSNEAGVCRERAYGTSGKEKSDSETCADQTKVKTNEWCDNMDNCMRCNGVWCNGSAPSRPASTTKLGRGSTPDRPAFTTVATSAGGGGTVNGFGAHIEGASVDSSGKYLYATHFRGSSVDNFQRRNVIGRILVSDVKAGRLDAAEAWFTGEADAYFNGMKWGGNIVYLADVGRGEVLRVDTLNNNEATVFCSDPKMKIDGESAVPNDLTLDEAGNIYLSGQNWGANKGALWMCTKDGTAKELEGGMHRTNGIALSPDGSTLFLTEADGNNKIEQQVIYQYAVDPVDGTVSDKTLFYRFTGEEAAADSDGMRFHGGRLYVTRNGLGQVDVFLPQGVGQQGRRERKIKIGIDHPTNLAFESDGGTLFVVGRCKGNGYGQGDGCVDATDISDMGKPSKTTIAIAVRTTTSAGKGKTEVDEGTRSALPSKTTIAIAVRTTTAAGKGKAEVDEGTRSAFLTVLAAVVSFLAFVC